MKEEQSRSLRFEASEPERLDSFLARELGESDESFSFNISRSKIAKLIKANKVLVGGQNSNKSSLQLSAGDTVEIKLSDLAERRESQSEPYDFPLDIVAENQWYLVVNKPPGIVVHPGAGNPDQTLLNALVYYAKNKFTPLLVHRLDKDTSGLLLVAKSELAQNKLQQLFQTREISRTYNALVAVTPRHGRIIQETDSGRVEQNITRHPQKKTLYVTTADPEKGRTAITNWQVIEKFNLAYLLAVKLETGRTHQIRVHMESINSPVIGDLTYGQPELLPKEFQLKAAAFGRQALHAKALEFQCPFENKTVSFESELPNDFIELIDSFRTS